MSEYISREDINRVLQERNGANKSCLIKAKEKGLHPTEQYFYNLLFEDEQISSLIEELTSADVRPNIHGHWINETPHTDGCPIYTCSECGRSNLWESPFCPSCGADMREPKGEKGTT